MCMTFIISLPFNNCFLFISPTEPQSHIDDFLPERYMIGLGLEVWKKELFA